jgi:Pyruvate/2-oxoacid:ferredoxin oxidoreductase gamma subunit
VERELIITGIGGQGVQLAAAVIARAAVLEGLEAQVFGSYAGMMRGGATESTVVVADGPIASPPTVGSTWSAVLMHHEHAEPVLARLAGGGVVFVNSSVVDPGTLDTTAVVVAVPATDIALSVGGMLVASMVMVGAYASATGLVALGSLQHASRASLPPYRAKHANLNDLALRAGFDAAAPGSAPAWGERTATR